MRVTSLKAVPVQELLPVPVKFLFPAWFFSLNSELPRFRKVKNVGLMEIAVDIFGGSEKCN